MERLWKLSRKNIQLFDKLITVDLRIKFNLVDDMDYFTFPKKFLLDSIIDIDMDYLLQERIINLKKFKIMAKAILSFVDNLKKDKNKKFPPAIYLL